MGKAKANHKRNEIARRTKKQALDRTIAQEKFAAAEAKKARKAESRARHSEWERDSGE